jgi:hypothetical protein
MKTYRRVTYIQAKIFEKGDEDKMVGKIPFLNGEIGSFGEDYLVFGPYGVKWLCEKRIFEKMYELEIDDKDE